MMPFKKFGHRLFRSLYERIFREKLNQEALKFFTRTSYVAIGTLFGSLLTFVFNILGARILGPTDFGNLALVTTVGTILAISMGINLQAATKYGSGAQDDSTRSRIISTFGWQVALLTVGSIVIYTLLSAPLANAFDIPPDVFVYAIAFAAITTLAAFTFNSLRILFRMKAFALLNALQSVIVIAAFLILISLNVRSLQAAVFSLYIGNAAIAAILVVYLRHYLKFQIDRFWSRKLLHYAIIALPGLIAGAFMGIDRIFINMFTTTGAVGLYNAYYLPSITVSLTLWSIFSAAFFPYASKSKNKLDIFYKVNKAVPYIAAALLPLILLIEFIIFILYGRQYPFSAELGLLFAFAGTTCFIYACYSALMASEGPRGAKVNTLCSIAALAVLIAVNVVLIPLIGISGAAIALIAAYLVAALYLVSRRRVLRER